MESQSEYAIRQRGGIELRDYTENGPPSLRQQLKKSGNFNFDLLGRPLIFASLGLGLFELLMPRRFLRLIGVRQRGYTGLVRLLGLRELGSAFMIFSQSRPFTGVWSRVVGDVMDLGLLSGAFATRRAEKDRLAAATATVAGLTALDLFAATQIEKNRQEAAQISDFTQEDMDERTRSRAFRVTRSITINRPAEDLYRYWHNFENLPNFMYHLENVQVDDERRSHWVAKAPAGQRVEWDAEITEDRPNELIAWASVPGSEIMNSGEVRFEPAPKNYGTVVRVQIDYHPPGGALGKAVAKLFGEEPGQQVAGDLRRFKQVVETGEVLRSDAVHAGTGQKMQRPARPLHDAEKGRKNKANGKFARQSKAAQEEEEIRSRQ